VAWAAGSGFGGLDTGAVAINTWYYVWAIKRSDNGTTDFLFSTSSTDPIMPAAYDSKHCIGMVKTDGSANILPFKQYDDMFMWVTRIVEVNAAAGPAAETALILSGIPVGFNVRALLKIGPVSSVTPGDTYYVRPIFQTTGVAGEVICQVNAIAVCSSQFECLTNTSAQVYHKATDADVTVTLESNGWIFERGRNS
jgi:hypothetical protein